MAQVLQLLSPEQLAAIDHAYGCIQAWIAQMVDVLGTTLDAIVIEDIII